jgi:DNA-binding response OmpR family regulator/two-component sensor histidine kinase
MMLRNAQRLERLVNQILDLSRIESGNLQLKVARMDLVETVRGLAAAFESLAKRKGVHYTVSTGNDPIVGWFDEDALEKIVTNLLSNAFKFTNPGGEVRITVRMDAIDYHQPAGSVIEISDTGIGMPPGQLDRIFDRFYQIDTSHTREHEGTGLGLALTKELVELHKGNINVRSELGVGSTFTVWLPLGSEHWKAEELVHQGDGHGSVTPSMPAFDEAERVEQQAEQDGESEELPLVLIIEDNSDMRRYMRKILDTQYRVMESVDGEEGIQKAEAMIPELIVCDVMMPKADGFEVCNKLKTDEKTSHIPIILLTAKAGNEHKLEGLKTGADDYLIKPFDASELLVRGKNLIEQRQKLRERFRREITLQPHDISITPMEERFLDRAKAIVENHLSDTGFGVEPFAAEMALSRSQLHRKLFALTGLSPGDFIRGMRLQRAALLLQQHFGTVSEVAYEVGFSNPSHFTESFRKQFGLAPSEYSRLQA